MVTTIVSMFLLVCVFFILDDVIIDLREFDESHIDIETDLHRH
jgi:hypothetical protein